MTTLLTKTQYAGKFKFVQIEKSNRNEQDMQDKNHIILFISV